MWSTIQSEEKEPAYTGDGIEGIRSKRLRSSEVKRVAAPIRHGYRVSTAAVSCSP